MTTNLLKAYKLKHSYYNMTEQGSTSLQLNLNNKTTHDTIVAWHEDVLSSHYSNISKTLEKIDILLLPAVGNLVAH